MVVVPATAFLRHCQSLVQGHYPSFFQAEQGVMKGKVKARKKRRVPSAPHSFGCGCCNVIAKEEQAFEVTWPNRCILGPPEANLKVPQQQLYWGHGFSVYDFLVNDNHRGCLDASRARSGQQATQTSCQRSARSLAQRMWITERIGDFSK